MKKFVGPLILLLVLAFASCQKSTPANLSETKAHVLDGGDPAADGLGFFITLDDSKEKVVAINLPTEYQQKGINSAVAIRVVNTGKTAHLGYGPVVRVVYLVSIRKF